MDTNNSTYLWQKKPENVLYNIEDALAYLKENKIITFNIDYQLTFTNQKQYVTDKTHPFYKKDEVFANTTIDREFYEKYKDRIDKIIKENFEEQVYKGELSYLNVSSITYNEELLKKAVEKNPKIRIYFYEDVIVSENIIKFLQRHHIQSEQGRKELSSANIFGKYNYYDVIDSEYEEITVNPNAPFEDARFVPNGIKIKIERKDKNSDDNTYLNNVYNMISAFREYGNTSPIEFEFHNREVLEKSKFVTSNFKNVFVSPDSVLEYYPLERIIEDGKVLQLMTKEIDKEEYSPFEKYMAAYNIVKQYKAYQENPENLRSGMNISEVLNNEYIVCAGYGNLLRELLKRIDIPATNLYFQVDISYDKGFTEEEKPMDFELHDRTLLYIDDSKYGIKGVYVADPTWDGDVNQDLFVHALMTFDQTKNEYRMQSALEDEYLFNIHNIEEWKRKIHKYLSIKLKQQGYWSENLLYFTKYSALLAYKEIMNYLKLFDKKNYDELLQKYPSLAELLQEYYSREALSQKVFFIDTYITIKENLDIFDAFFDEVAPILISLVGKEVQLEDIIKAGLVSRKTTLDPECIEKYERKVYLDNKRMQEFCFPYENDDTWKKRVV